MPNPSYTQVVSAIQNAVLSVLTVNGNGDAYAAEADINSAIEAGAAIAFAGLSSPDTLEMIEVLSCQVADKIGKSITDHKHGSDSCDGLFLAMKDALDIAELARGKTVVQV